MGKTMQNFTEQTHTLGLYDPQFEHDACGIGAVVDIKGRKSHQTVDDALCIVERLEHRAGKDAEGKTGDGVWCKPFTNAFDCDFAISFGMIFMLINSS